MKSFKMTASSRRRVFLAIFVYAYWAALFTATHVPGKAMPDTGGVSDKLLHGAAYAILTLLMLVFRTSKGDIEGGRGRSTVTVATLVIMAYALVDELLQIPIPGRQGEIQDFLADIGGILAGLLLFALLRCPGGRIRNLGSAGDSVRD